MQAFSAAPSAQGGIWNQFSPPFRAPEGRHGLWKDCRSGESPEEGSQARRSRFNKCSRDVGELSHFCSVPRYSPTAASEHLESKRVTALDWPNREGRAEGSLSFLPPSSPFARYSTTASILRLLPSLPTYNATHQHAWPTTDSLLSALAQSQRASLARVPWHRGTRSSSRRTLVSLVHYDGGAVRPQGEHAERAGDDEGGRGEAGLLIHRTSPRSSMR